MGEYRTLKLQEIYAYIQKDDAVVDERLLGQCRRHAGYLIPQFADFTGTSNLIIRYRAAWLLANLDVEQGIGRLILFIQDANDFLKNARPSDPSQLEKVRTARNSALEAILKLPLKMSWELEQSLTKLLLPMLYECRSISDFDRVTKALQLVGSSLVVDELLQFFSLTAGLQRAHCAVALIRNINEARAVEAAVELLTIDESPCFFNPHENSDDVWALVIAYLSYGPGKINPHISRTLVSYICSQYNSTDTKINDRIARCLELMPASIFAEPENENVLDEILDSRLNKWVKSIAIKIVTELDPSKGCDIVFTVVNSNTKDMNAAKMLSMAARALKEKGVTARLAEIKSWLYRNFEKDRSLLQSLHNGEFPYWEAFMDVASPTDPLVENYSHLLDPTEQMRLYCLRNNITVEAIAKSVESSSHVVQLSDEAKLKFAKDWSKGRSHYQAVCDLISSNGRFGQVKLHTGGQIPDYRVLLSELERISSPFFVISDLAQSWRETSKPEPDFYHFDVIFNERSTSFRIPANGGLLNIEPFLEMMNYFLQSVGNGGRFFNLHTRDNKGTIVFAPGEHFMTFAKTIRFPILADAKNMKHDTIPPGLYPLAVDDYSCEYLKMSN
ncbi:MAG: hypothetical protein ACRBBN_15725 [Methyloligellaceae bacterium]